MKQQALFPLKDKSKKIKCRLLQFLFGALRRLNKFTGEAQKVQHSIIFRGGIFT